MPATHLLLAAAVLAAWCPPMRVSPRRTLPAWAALLVAATAAGLAQGFVQWQGAAALAAMAGVGLAAQRTTRPALRGGLTLVALWLALAFALHAVPGFRNPAVVQGAVLGEGAAPYTLWLNFDKAAAGLLLLACFVPRAATGADWSHVFRTAALVLPPTLLLVFGTAAGLGIVAWDPKLPAFVVTFLVANLLFTCVAEEAFFRGVIQARLAGWSEARWWVRVVVGVSAVLFGLAHAAGGPPLVLLATLAGLGYALAFAHGRQVEASILAHFGFNVVHLLCVTYPGLLGPAGPT